MASHRWFDLGGDEVFWPAALVVLALSTGACAMEVGDSEQIIDDPSAEVGSGDLEVACPVPARTISPLVGRVYDAPAPSTNGTALRTFLQSVPNGSAASPSIVRLRAGATYTTSVSLTLTNRSFITIDGRGALIRSTNTSPNRSVFSFASGSSLSLYNVDLSADVSGTVEQGHGVALRGVQGFYSSGVRVFTVKDDGFWIGFNPALASRPQSTNVLLENFTTCTTQRHGLSVVGGSGVTIRRGLIDKSSTTVGVPIDLEPLNGDHDVARNIVIEEMTFGAYPTPGTRSTVQANGFNVSDVTIRNSRTVGAYFTRDGRSFGAPFLVSFNQTGYQRWARFRVLGNTSDPASPLRVAFVRAKQLDGIEVGSNRARFGGTASWLSASSCTGINVHDNAVF